MSFVVAGVSGNTGKVVAESLLAQKRGVKVVVRDSAKGEPWKAKGAEVAVADLGDADALARALRGAEGAYLLIPPNFATADYRAYQDQLGTALAEAVRASRVPHVVLLSSVGAQHPSGTGPIVGLYRMEEKLRGEKATAATFLRAGYFMENLGSSLATLPQGFIPSFLPASLGIEMVPTFTGFGMPKDLAELYREMIGGLADGRVKFEGTHRRVAASTSIETFLRGALAK